MNETEETSDRMTFNDDSSCKYFLYRTIGSSDQQLVESGFKVWKNVNTNTIMSIECVTLSFSSLVYIVLFDTLTHTLLITIVSQVDKYQKWM